MRIGGLQRCSYIDYPKHISAIIFTIGCNFRCPYCHNPELVDETAQEIPVADVLSFLRTRVGKLDGVTITGGEPTMHGDLLPFMRSIKEMGYDIKLDTNGTRPDTLQRLRQENLVDYIAMDIKAPFAKYEKTVARPTDIAAIKRSVALLMEGDTDYEFRTTVIKALLSPDDLRQIGEDIRGAKRYYLQKFISSKILNPGFIAKTTYTDEEFAQFQETLSAYVQECAIR